MKAENNLEEASDENWMLLFGGGVGVGAGVGWLILKKLRLLVPRRICRRNGGISCWFYCGGGEGRIMVLDRAFHTFQKSQLNA